jgi:glycogen(starch) synthase
MGHDVTLLTSGHGDNEKPRQETRGGYEVRRYRQIARPFGNSITPSMVPAMRRLLKSHDVVHAHSHLYFSTNMAALLARVDSTPLVITNHGLHSQTAPMAVQKAYAPLAKFTFNSADRVLCYTETDRDRLRDRGITAPVSVIHNGIDCETFVPDASDAEQLQILFVGRLKAAKGVRELLDAFALLADDMPDVTLRFVGEGPLREALEQTATEYGLTDRVTFAGRVPNEELPETYAESAVFALPSEVEGFPRTVLEAMACGTPVVTSELPQLQSVVEQVGETAPFGDVEALAAALQRLLAAPDRRERLGQRARECVLEEYSWSETVRETTAVYHELME